jgi:hypothetical protein
VENLSRDKIKHGKRGKKKLFIMRLIDVALYQPNNEGGMSTSENERKS